MRRCVLFLAGVLVGLAVKTLVAQNVGVVGLNHVALSVPNLDEAVSYYTQKMGFREAFRATDEQGRPTLVYVQMSRNTFLELLPATAQRPAGFNHLGAQVEGIAEVTTMFRRRGVTVEEPRVSPNSKAVLASVTDLNGVRIELAELTPDSLQRKAMDAWK